MGLLFSHFLFADHLKSTNTYNSTYVLVTQHSLISMFTVQVASIIRTHHDEAVIVEDIDERIGIFYIVKTGVQFKM